MEPIRTVTLIGAGKMGVKIAARAATFGFKVRVYDVSKDMLKKASDLIRADIQATCDEGVSKEDPKVAFERVTFHHDLEDAVAETDLIIEAVPENLDLKKEVFSELDRIAAEHVIIATNSSSIPVSKIEDAVERRDKVANIHFYAQHTGITPMVDLMGGTETSDETMDRGREWIEGIGCLAPRGEEGVHGLPLQPDLAGREAGIPAVMGRRPRGLQGHRPGLEGLVRYDRRALWHDGFRRARCGV